MARNIDKMLNQLRSRRTGLDRLSKVATRAQDELFAKARLAESWQKRAQKPYTKYALGAMEEVGPDYTRISIETASRVGKQLRDKLNAQGMPVDFRLQGSVPLNVHIRGVSDVDLLTIDDGFFTYEGSGRWATAGNIYLSPTARTSVGVLSTLRSECENILKSQYPAATVDTFGGKAVAISGGSLARPVDVVPSHWYDCANYQATAQECERGITILDKKVPTTINNWPFLHIKRIGERDTLAMGSLKKAIRLCKNVKSDAIEGGKSIPLPSFDIAAIMHQADLSKLRTGYYFELAILAETQRFLDELTMNESAAMRLTTPDGSRQIFDSHDKLSGLRRLSMEMDDLLKEVAAEQNPYVTAESLTLSNARNIVTTISIPEAA
jgi:hypothetical protein